MSSFFTLPASQRKRKRPQTSERPTGERGAAPKSRRHRDDSISGSDGSDDEAAAGRKYADADEDRDDDSEDGEEGFEDEDPAAKRIRLAEQYLANAQKEIVEDAGFDAADVDADNLRRRMGDRLKEDTAESRGMLYRWMADTLHWSAAEQSMARIDGKAVTGLAIQGSFVYTGSKDLTIRKWCIPDRQSPALAEAGPQHRAPQNMRVIRYTRGDRRRKKDASYQHHTLPILCIAASQDGKFVVTGGADRKIIVWDASSLTALKVFTQHRDAVNSLVFRRGTNQLYSASKDRTVKIWSLDELAYIETLFGHQDEVVGVSALAQEKCVTVGARDRTARLWKVVEETQLVFRGGGAPLKPKAERTRLLNGGDSVVMPSAAEAKSYNEGSMDRIVCIDDETFVTGSDNGALALWNIHKKKPVFTYGLAHGLEPPLPLAEVSAELEPDETALSEPQPRWVTALCAIPYSDTFVTGSWDGFVRAWRISRDKRRIESLGPIGYAADDSQDLLEIEDYLVDGVLVSKSGKKRSRQIVGIINDLAIVHQGDRGREGVLVAVAVGKDHRLGRWREMKEAKNSVVLFHVRGNANNVEGEEELDSSPMRGDIEETFSGFS